MYHIPVLLNESIDGLNIHPNGIYVDVTYGGGGHSKEILASLTKGQLYAFDQDQDSAIHKINDPRFHLFHENFRFIKNFLQFHGVHLVDGILADLGISSHQIDDPGRGFSTRLEGILDLRMNQGQKVKGQDIINDYSLDHLKKIFKLYGEIRNAGALGNLIITERAIEPILSTSRLKEIATKCAPKGKENKYLAQVFQAIRIEVNEEIEALKEMLLQASEILNPGGRLVVISYHSIEDRIVKNFIKSGNFEGVIKKDFYGHPQIPLKAINRKPIVPNQEELLRNSRSRSAKLRIAEKIK